MKQRRSASIIMAASLLLLAGCQKDEVAPAGQGRLMLNLESFGNGSTKTVLGADDRSLQWLTGDQVCINGTDYAVTASGESAYVAGVPDATVYKAVFPASMVAGRSMAGSTVTATLPRQYEYRTEGGLQVLDAPLAAVGDGSDGLTFRHLTGALTVVIENTTSNTLYIDTVYVSSAQQLCGDVTVDFDALTSISPNIEPANAADTMVLLTVPYNTLSVAAGATVKVQVPVLPVSDANRFTVHVATRHEGTRYDFDRRQGSASNALGRNQMGYVPASIAASGSHITVKPLFEYDGAQYEEFGEYWVDIYSPLDFKLLSDATNSEWLIPGTVDYSYKNLRSVAFIGTIDMEGYSISQLQLGGYDGMLDVGGTANCQINNLTIDGPCLISTDWVEIWQYVNNIVFNNLTINCNSGNTVTSIIANFDSEDFGISNVRVNGVTFNITNNNSNATVTIGGLVGECDLYRTSNHGDMATGFEGNSVTDITINVIGTQLKEIQFGGLAGYFYNGVYEDDLQGLQRITNCSYIQNKPLTLNASGSITYGGIFGNAFDMSLDNTIDLSCQNVTLVHNVNLDAPVVVAGGIMGYFDNECQEGDVLWQNMNYVVTQSGTIDYVAPTTSRVGKKIATAVAPCDRIDWTDADLVEYNIEYSGIGNINDDALTIIAH